MFIIVVFVMLSILVILLAIRYLRINADVLSREEFQIAASERTKKLKKEDPRITCDYCGTVIDTRIHKKCPNCGAPYGEDTQWNDRNDISGQWINKNAKDTADMQRRKANILASQKTKALRYSIVTIICCMVMFAIMIAAVFYFRTRTESRKDETINVNSYDHYVRANYHVLGDNTIFDHDGVTVKITGFYEDSRFSSYVPVKIEFTLENNTSEKRRVMMKTCGMNGIAGNHYIYVYDVFDPGTTVFYENVYYVPGGAIQEMVFDRITVEQKDFRKRYEIKDLVYVKTSAALKEEIEKPQGERIYTSDLIDIYSTDSEVHMGYNVSIQNKSDYKFTVKCNGMMIDSEKVEYHGIYDAVIPPGYLFKDDYVRVTDESFIGYENKEVKMTLSFSCEEDPTLDFSTGYIELK